MQTQIRTKTEFLRLSNLGLLGNRFRSWDTVRGLEKSGYRGWLTIRSRTANSPYFVPLVAYSNLEGELMRLWMAGAKTEDLYFQEVPPPDTQRILNFEAMFLDTGELYVLHGAVFPTLNLRHDLEQNGKVVTGFGASLLLKALMGEQEYDDLMAHLEYRDNPVIEASIFSQPVGVEHKKVIYWEQRHY